METYISLVETVIAFYTLISLMVRGANPFITAIIASLIAIVSGNMNIYKALTENYMTGSADYYRSYYLAFSCGTLLGTTMELSGAATSIAKWVTGKFKSMVYPAIPLATGIICYGGVTAITSIFVTSPIALAILRENNIPRRLMSVALYSSSCTLAVIAPGAPQVQNIIPTQSFGVNLMAGTVVGFISSTLILLIGSFQLSVMIKNIKEAGEVFTSRDDDKDKRSGSLPSPLISLIPMLVTVIAVNPKNKAGENITPIEYASLMGIATTITLMYRRLDRAELTEAVFQSTPKVAVAIFNICTIVRFGTVIKSIPAFELLVDVVIHIPGNYLVGVPVGIALLAGFCGSVSGGLGIITPIFYDIFGAMQGISYTAIARVMVIAFSFPDPPPHSGPVNTSVGLCGEPHKSAYIPILCLSVVTPVIYTAVVVILLTLFPGWPQNTYHLSRKKPEFFKYKYCPVCYTCRKQKKWTGQRMKFWAYFLIPVYMVLPTRGYNWFTTNFPVIGNFFDRKKSFFLRGVLVGSYLYMIYRNIKSRAALHPTCARLIPAALVLLLCAITTPYLPEGLSLKSVLHIVFAFLSAVLALLYLLWIARTRYQTEPGIYKPFLYGWGAIAGVSATLLAVAGIISNALEIYVMLTLVAMAQCLACRVAVQEEMPDSGGDIPEKALRRKPLGKRRNHLLT